MVRFFIPVLASVLVGAFIPACASVAEPMTMVPEVFPQAVDAPIPANLKVRELPGAGQILRGGRTSDYHKLPVENLGVAVEESLRRSGVVVPRKEPEKAPFDLEVRLLHADVITEFGGPGAGVVDLSWRLVEKETGWVPWSMRTSRREVARFGDSLTYVRGRMALERAVKECIRDALSDLAQARIENRRARLAVLSEQHKRASSSTPSSEFIEAFLPRGHWCTSGAAVKTESMKVTVKTGDLQSWEKRQKLTKQERCMYLEKVVASDSSNVVLEYTIDPQSGVSEELVLRYLGEPTTRASSTWTFERSVYQFDDRRRLTSVRKPLDPTSAEFAKYGSEAGRKF